MQGRVRRFGRWLAAGAACSIVGAWGGAGCAPTTIGSGLFSYQGVRAESSINGSSLDVRPRVAVFDAIDEQSADLYLSDLPTDVLLRLSRGDASVLTEAPPVGSIVHVHMFLVPSAGRTPIDFDANNFTVTHLVFGGLAEDGTPAIGVYGGGGFLLPDTFGGNLDGAEFGGVVRSGTLAFVSGTPAFVDRLDGASYDGKIKAGADPESVTVLASAMRRIVSALPD